MSEDCTIVDVDAIIESMKKNDWGAVLSLMRNGGVSLPQEDVVAKIRCNECGAVYDANRIDSDRYSIVYECDKCGAAIKVRFFGKCPFCDQDVGFQEISNGEFIGILAKEAVKGFMLGCLNPVALVEGVGLKRFLDDVPSALDCGYCQLCGRKFLICPECRNLVHMKKDVGLHDIVTCEYCGIRMRQP